MKGMCTISLDQPYKPVERQRELWDAIAAVICYVSL